MSSQQFSTSADGGSDDSSAEEISAASFCLVVSTARHSTFNFFLNFVCGSVGPRGGHARRPQPQQALRQAGDPRHVLRWGKAQPFHHGHRWVKEVVRLANFCDKKKPSIMGVCQEKVILIIVFIAVWVKETWGSKLPLKPRQRVDPEHILCSGKP